MFSTLHCLHSAKPVKFHNFEYKQSAKVTELSAFEVFEDRQRI